MGQFNRIVLILVILLVTSQAETLRKSKNAHKQQKLVIDNILSNNMKISLDKDSTVEKKISVINFIEESRSIRKNLPTYKNKRYDIFTKTIETYDKEITPETKNKFISMIQKTNGKSVGLMNHGNTFYTGKIQVGNRDQYYKMIFDSGSTLIFLNSVQCESIGCIRGNQYNSEESPTFKDVDLEVEVEFGSGVIQGEMGIDTFYVGDMAIQKVEFMEIIEQDGAVFENGDFDGLIGLAFPSLGDGIDTLVDYMKDQGLIQQKTFSFYMSRQDESETSFVSFGQIDNDVINGNIKYHKVANPLYWTVQAQEIRLGGHNTGLCTAEFPCALAIDSGTSIVAGPSDAVEHLTNLIIDRGFECNEIKKMPTISFIIDGEEYTLQSSEYMITSNGAFANMYEHDDSPVECSPAFIALDVEEPSLGPMWILGDIFMSKYYTVFDRENKRIGFAKLKNLDAKFYQKPSKMNDDEFDFNILKRMEKKNQ